MCVRVSALPHMTPLNTARTAGHHVLLFMQKACFPRWRCVGLLKGGGVVGPLTKILGDMLDSKTYLTVWATRAIDQPVPATCLGAFRRASRRSGCMQATAGTADPATKSPSTHQRSSSYTAFEENSWETTFDQSGTLQFNIIWCASRQLACGIMTARYA